MTKVQHNADTACSARTPMIFSSVNLVRFIVHPQVGPGSNRRAKKSLEGQPAERTIVVIVGIRERFWKWLSQLISDTQHNTGDLGSAGIVSYTKMRRRNR